MLGTGVRFSHAAQNMVTVAERFRRMPVEHVYVGSNPTSHPKIKVMKKTLRFFKRDNKWYDVFGEHPEHIYITKIESK